jgi:hypothetical protein
VSTACESEHDRCQSEIKERRSGMDASRVHPQHCQAPGTKRDAKGQHPLPDRMMVGELRFWRLRFRVRRDGLGRLVGVHKSWRGVRPADGCT